VDYFQKIKQFFIMSIIFISPTSSASGLESLRWVMYEGASGTRSLPVEEKSIRELMTQGMADYDTERWMAALESFTSASKIGSGDADYMLGEMHEEGLGTELDEEKSIKFYTSAVVRGGTAASSSRTSITRLQNRTARALFNHGMSARQSTPAEALRYFTAAAKKGHRQSQFTAGLMCETGEGCDVDEEKAREFYRLAGLQGHDRADRHLVRLTNKIIEEAARAKGRSVTYVGRYFIISPPAKDTPGV
jgi:hypothetical protein